MDRASNTDIHETMMLAVEEDAMVIVAAKGEVMNNQVPKYVTRQELPSCSAYRKWSSAISRRNRDWGT